MTPRKDAPDTLTPEIDPARVAAGKSLACPYCGSSATAQPTAGRSGVRRLLVTCTGLDCRSLHQIVEIDEATGKAQTICSQNAAPARSPRPGNTRPPKPRPKPNQIPDEPRRVPLTDSGAKCRVEHCTKNEYASYLCFTHYVSWRDCRRPNLHAWLAAGAPGPDRWGRRFAPHPRPDQDPTSHLSPAIAVRHAIKRAGRRPTFDRIVKVVCYRMHLRPGDLATSRRHKHLVLAREVVAYLAHDWCSMSYPEIAAATGQTNHSTAIGAYKRMSRSIESDHEIMLMDGPVRAAPLLIQIIDALSTTTTP